MLLPVQDIMLIGGVPAAVTVNASGRLMRGVFMGLNADVDFYAPTQSELASQGTTALVDFFAVCRRTNRSPLKPRGNGQPGYVVEDLYKALEEPARRRGIDLYRVVTEQARALDHEPTPGSRDWVKPVDAAPILISL
ncbi:toxin-antitoxin system protein HicB [Acetobacter sp. TBRC 12305]|uniref:Toxin-antitoxin system protein HicB n=1 Tax=Acetobacter garciniae TaxID=2817435 RepID=A0A939HKP4_9PROT|nr:toxin-antitoxin system protein HicB [Acetobacter garciniae]MBO1325262.1 toxin-antitoxin system protein HicB [Acetobacter garciniae]MBX0344766.1 toxin-antitoxin system protein HicB [Acetobacter garciniae]